MPEALKKMYGPLPLWGWLAVILGGLGIAWYFNKQAGDAGGGEEESPILGVGQAGGAGSPGFIPVGPPTPQGESEIVTNDEWAKKASNELLARGYDANLVDTAIRKYLVSEKLDTNESAVIAAALRAVGAPPVPLPPPFDDQQEVGTNAEWVGAAVKATVTQGHFSTTRQDWLVGYLEGKYLSYDAQKTVSAAINAIGSPPSPPPDIKRIYRCWDTTHPWYNNAECKTYRKGKKKPKMTVA